MLTLEAQKRNIKTDKNETLREKGFIPAVLYGKKTPSTPITLSQKQFLSIWKDAGESTVVSVKTPEGEFEALIHDIDIDPVTDLPRHADFYVFEKGKKIDVDVPLEFVGTSTAVKELGGVLVKVLYEVHIEALPKDLPHSIEVDISSLSNFGSQITAKDIVLPAGVTLQENPEEVIVLVDEPKEEVIEETPMDISEIEVEKKGKEAKEGEEEAVEGETPAVAEKSEKKSDKKG
ncbi:MAG: 50S ribosomal protein L25 [Patescibacteria group bacterium]|nr:50S ribosomal protein L25 [bacterium]MDZ4240826.1 50S ribosomal protein L25 [Patescibacteria group bacterium]